MAFWVTGSQELSKILDKSSALPERASGDCGKVVHVLMELGARLRNGAVGEEHIYAMKEMWTIEPIA